MEEVQLKARMPAYQLMCQENVDTSYMYIHCSTQVDSMKRKL